MTRDTSERAINYYKIVLSVAMQLLMILLIAIGNDLLASSYAKMTKGTLNFEELEVMLIFCVALLLLINRTPPLLAGIITGSGVGSAVGIGNFGAGAMASTTMGAAGMAGAAVMGGAANAAGSASPLAQAAGFSSKIAKEAGSVAKSKAMRLTAGVQKPCRLL